jgi:clan AA aspartic protease (TIGR02281 family)
MKQIKSRNVIWFLLIILWAGLLYVAYKYDLLEKLGTVTGNQKVALSASSAQQNINTICDSHPPLTARSFEIDPVKGYRKKNQTARIDIENRHHSPVLALLTSPEGDKEYQGVYLSSGGKSSLSVLPGDYGLSILTGKTWCNLDTGFINGAMIHYSEKISASERSVSTMSLLTLGNLPEELMFSLNEGGLNRSVGNGNILELSRMPDGHFYVAGNANDYGLTFLIDTGATFSKIPYSVAKELDLIKKCTPSKFQTAGGLVQGCMTVIDRIDFGGFYLRNLEVSFTPGIEVALLGMNVISQFRVQQNSETMMISMN